MKHVELPAELVTARRKEDFSFIENPEYSGIRDEAECWEKTGAGPVSVRWVDTDKGCLD